MDKINPSVENAEFEGRILQIYYIPLHDAILWDENPKLHDIGDIITSIQNNGFRDAPIYDETLGAMIAGNGRTHALMTMCRDKHPLPEGILRHKEEGYWCLPVQFGINASSMAQARQFAIDHNNLVLTGGDLTGSDIVRMYKLQSYIEVLEKIELDGGDMPITFAQEDFDRLRYGFESDEEGSDWSDGDTDEHTDSLQAMPEEVEDGDVSIDLHIDPEQIPQEIQAKLRLWQDTLQDMINQVGEEGATIDKAAESGEIGGSDAFVIRSALSVVLGRFEVAQKAIGIYLSGED